MPDLAEQMKADALEAQKLSRKHLVLELDFSLDSVEELEAVIDTVDYTIPGGKSDDNIELLARVWGAYLGEALRRARGGEWAEQDGRIQLRTQKGTVCPQEIVRRRLTEGEDQNLGDFYKQALQDL